MNNLGTSIHQVQVKASAEKIWDTLTRQGEPLPFFFGAVLETDGIKVGGQVRMRSKDGKYTGVVGEILECEPHLKLSHSWKFSHFDDPLCKMTYELEPSGEETLLTVAAEEIPPKTGTEQQIKQSGRYISQTLKVVAEGRRLPMGARFVLFMCWVFKAFTPKKCLSENWPLDRKIT